MCKSDLTHYMPLTFSNSRDFRGQPLLNRFFVLIQPFDCGFDFLFRLLNNTLSVFRFPFVYECSLLKCYKKRINKSEQSLPKAKFTHTPILSADKKNFKISSKIQAKIGPKSVNSLQVFHNWRSDCLESFKKWPTKLACVNPA